MRPGLGRDLDEAVEDRAIREHPRRVVREVDDDEPGGRRDLAAQQVEIERPAVGLVELVERDVRAGRARDLVEALVAGPGHDRVVARADEDVGEAEDRLLGAGEGQGPRRVRSCRRAPRSRAAAAGGRSTPCSRAGGRPTGRGSRRRPARAARPSGRPGRPRRTAGARRRTPSGRSSARGRNRRCARAHDAARRARLADVAFNPPDGSRARFRATRRRRAPPPSPARSRSAAVRRARRPPSPGPESGGRATPRRPEPANRSGVSPPGQSISVSPAARRRASSGSTRASASNVRPSAIPEDRPRTSARRSRRTRDPGRPPRSPPRSPRPARRAAQEPHTGRERRREVGREAAGGRPAGRAQRRIAPAAVASARPGRRRVPNEDQVTHVRSTWAQDTVERPGDRRRFGRSPSRRGSGPPPR